MLTRRGSVCVLFGMAETSKHFLNSFTDLTLTSAIWNHNLGRMLRDAGLFTKPSRGSGHKKTSIAAPHISNFYLAQAAAQIVDAPEVVRQLRSLVKAGPTPPMLGPGNLGDALDRMIGGVPADLELVPIIAAAVMPHEIRVMTNPYRVDMIWYGHNKPPRAESYTLPQGSPLTSTPLQRVTVIHPDLIELGQRMLAERVDETQNAAPARTALQVDQPKAYAAGKSDRPKSEDTGVACVALLQGSAHWVQQSQPI